MGSGQEVVGYVASALVVISLAMAGTVRLRLINLLGCLTFVAYGVLIKAWPVAIANTIISALDVWYLVRELRTRRDVGAVPIDADAPYLDDFVRAHLDDILRSQPGFIGVQPGSNAWLLTRDGLPVGALVGRVEGQTFHVDLDYVTPSFQDSRIGSWVHGAGAVLEGLGVARVAADPGTLRHREYLSRVGFHTEGSEMVRDL